MLRRSSIVAVAAWGCAAVVGCETTASNPVPAPATPDSGVEPHQLCDLAPDAGLPEDVFCLGLYPPGDSAHTRPEAVAYTPGATFWSDGAEKHRYLYLPPGTRIDTTDMDAWKFPVGTRAFKDFRLNGRLVETRILWKRAEKSWEVGTYIWDAEAKHAVRNTNPRGIVLDSGYEIPTVKDCDKCHHGGSDKLLGVEAVALALPGAEGGTLSELAKRGLLTRVPATTAVALPEDGTGRAAPALAFLHVNCGMACHSTRGLGDETKLVLRLRAGEFWRDGTALDDAGVDRAPVPVHETDIYRATFRQDPTTASVASAFPGLQRITPGAHDRSLVWVVASLRGKYQMPPLVSHVADTESLGRLAAWIDAIPVE